MSVGGLFSRLAGVGRLLRREGVVGLARRTIGQTLRRPLTAALRIAKPFLSFFEAQTLNRIGFEANLAGRRLLGLGTRLPLELRHIPIVPQITDDPIFGSRIQTTFTFEWFDSSTGLSGNMTTTINSNEILDEQQLLQNALDLFVNNEFDSTYLINLANIESVEVQIVNVDAVTRGY